jgi:hypothetical protein
LLFKETVVLRLSRFIKVLKRMGGRRREGWMPPLALYRLKSGERELCSHLLRLSEKMFWLDPDLNLDPKLSIGDDCQVRTVGLAFSPYLMMAMEDHPEIGIELSSRLRSFMTKFMEDIRGAHKGERAEVLVLEEGVIDFHPEFAVIGGSRKAVTDAAEAAVSALAGAIREAVGPWRELSDFQARQTVNAGYADMDIAREAYSLLFPYESDFAQAEKRAISLDQAIRFLKVIRTVSYFRIWTRFYSTMVWDIVVLSARSSPENDQGEVLFRIYREAGWISRETEFSAFLDLVQMALQMVSEAAPSDKDGTGYGEASLYYDHMDERSVFYNRWFNLVVRLIVSNRRIWKHRPSFGPKEEELLSTLGMFLMRNLTFSLKGMFPQGPT